MATRKIRAVSPMPNQRITSGISARCGMLRAICTLLSSSRAHQGKKPLSRPEREPDVPPMTKPMAGALGADRHVRTSLPWASKLSPASAT